MNLQPVGYPLNRILVWLQSRSGRYGKVKIPDPTAATAHPLQYKWLKMIHIWRSNYKIKCSYNIESKGFWRWSMTLRITGFMDWVHRPEFHLLENTMFRILDLCPSSGEDKKTRTLLGPLEGASPRSFASEAFHFLVFAILDDGQNAETQ
jgi:hypothetical protein